MEGNVLLCSVSFAYLHLHLLLHVTQDQTQLLLPTSPRMHPRLDTTAALLVTQDQPHLLLQITLQCTEPLSACLYTVCVLSCI